VELIVVRALGMAATLSVTLAVLGWMVFRLANHPRRSGNMEDRTAAPVPTAADIHVPPAPFAAYGH